MSSEFDVVVVGSCNIDMISYVPRLPKPGETIQGTRFEIGFGGKGANQAVAASRLGSRTALIGKVGDDYWGPKYISQLKEEGISTSHVDVIKGESTGIAQINVAYTGENHIVIVPGANNYVSPEDITKSKHMIRKCRVLICQLETPIAATIAALQNFPGTSILNAAPALANIPNEMITLPKVVCVNETEATEITGVNVVSLADAKLAIEKFLRMGCNTIIITMGEQGAAFASQSNPKPSYVRPPKVDVVVDTTGAGDEFLGAFAHISACYPDIPLYKKIGASCELAAITVQLPGAQKSFPTDRDYDFAGIATKNYECSPLW